MNLISSLVKTPYKINRGGNVSGFVSGSSDGGQTDSVVFSKAEHSYQDNMGKLKSNILKIQNQIRANNILLGESIFENEWDSLKLTNKQLEKDKAKAEIEMNATKTDTENFGKTRIEGCWNKKKDGFEYDLKFSDSDNAANLEVEMNIGYNEKTPYIQIENKGVSGKNQDIVEVYLPLSHRQMKDAEALYELLDSMPPQISSVEVKKKDGFFRDKTSINITGKEGKTLAFDIVNGKVKK